MSEYPDKLPVDPMDVNACLVLMMTEPEKAALAMHYLRRLVTSYRDLAKAADALVDAGNHGYPSFFHYEGYRTARAAVRELEEP